MFENTASLRTAPFNLPNAEAFIVPHVHAAVVSDAKLMSTMAKGNPAKGLRITDLKITALNVHQWADRPAKPDNHELRKPRQVQKYFFPLQRYPEKYFMADGLVQTVLIHTITLSDAIRCLP